jgi:hypothetical protein
MTRLTDLLEAVRGTPESYVGREWDSADGRRKVVRVMDMKGRPMLAVSTGDSRTTHLFAPGDIEKEIAWDGKYLASHKRTVAKQAAREAGDRAVSDKQARERKHLDRFLAKLSPMARGKVGKAMTKEVSVQRKFAPRYKHIERLVREGYRIGTFRGKRTMESPQGTFLTQRDLTKAALDYAEFLGR